MEPDWLAAQLDAGRSIEAIAREVGRPSSTVGYWVRKHGLASAHAPRHAARAPLEREVLGALVDQGLTLRQIAARVDRSYGTVQHWLREYGLATIHARRRQRPPNEDGEIVTRSCVVHGQVDFVRRGDGRGWRCPRCRAEAVSKRRRLVKRTLVAGAGGACVLCGYDRFSGALQFHHVDPEEKRFGLSNLGVARSLARARAEARKCVLLCANCHAEFEAGAATIPQELRPMFA